MKIGIDARFYGPQEKGLGRYVQKLIEHLQVLDHENSYVVFLQPDRIKDFPIPSPKWRAVAAPYRWYTISEQLKMPKLLSQEHVDFMHFPHFNVPIFYRGPYLITIHDLIITKHPKRRASTLGPFTYWLKYAAYKFVVANAVRKASRILTVSKHSKKEIQDYYHIPEDRIVVTYEAADPPRDLPALHDIAHYNIHAPYLLYVGNAHPHKNLERLLSAFAQFREEHPEYSLVLVGSHDYFYQRLMQEAETSKLNTNVIFPGFVPDEDLGLLYAQATAYVFPSMSEGFGLPPLEAMYRGTPVVSSNATCLPEILGDAVLYMDPMHVSAIAHAMEQIVTDQELRNQLIERGRQQVQRFSWDRMAKETLAIYQSFETSTHAT
ncbi:MAG: glycosyltransferase family 4 protein [Candidatus Kerfeldbacteria bacterium]|nr:glycosyltransferase family 4 protein [Candidatus Kerfeldbacteria bacterium]